MIGEAVILALADQILEDPAGQPKYLGEAAEDRAEIEKVVRSVLKKELPEFLVKELKKQLGDSDVEKAVVKLTGDALGRFFEIMFTRRGTWQSQLKL